MSRAFGASASVFNMVESVKSLKVLKNLRTVVLTAVTQLPVEQRGFDTVYSMNGCFQVLKTKRTLDMRW